MRLSTDTAAWLKGLVAAVVGAASNGVLVVIVNPGTFDIFSVAGWKNIASVCATSALVAGALYMKQSPLPNRTLTTTVSVTKEVSNSPPGS
jgi:hypothetical protein